LKALCVSDKVVERLYSPMVTTIAKDVDIIFGSGDLPYYYLEYLQSMLNVPLYYVHGNHDLEEEYIPSGDTLSGPRGGIDLDGRIEEVDGILIAGLQGSIRYKSEGTFQHTESEMWLKVFQMVPRLIYNQLTKGRALDVLITHSPPLNIHNGSDHVHTGFASFLWLMRIFKPSHLIHGHRHVYRPDERTETWYRRTLVSNIYPYKIMEVGKRQMAELRHEE